MSSSLLVEDVCSAEVLQQIKSKLNNKKKSLTCLWLQYQDMIDILKKFIKAERTGHWNLHLQAVFEMLPYYSASGHRPLQANNPVLVNALWKSIHESQWEPSEDGQYILDGGALIHRLPWPQGSTYDGVCQMYVNHAKQIYGTAVIVIDGYTNEPSTKDAIHLRRTGTCSGVAVRFTGDKLIQSTKDESCHIVRK